MLTRLSSKISERRAAAFISAAILASTSAIELARVWFAGRDMLVVDQLLGIAAALLLSITATAFVTNDQTEVGPLAGIAIFALVAHGGTLAITLSPFGVIYLTAAIVVVALVQVARGNATLGLARSWKRPQTARTAERAASRSPHATPA